ncbi:MAG: lysylphosphatidylglycerol synthase transmembrane domain-containing protein [Trebonia sp.]
MVEEVSDEAEVRQSSSSLLSAAASFRRPALTVLVLGAAAVIVVVARHTLAKSLHVLATASPGWLRLALAAEAVSLTAFGMSRTLLLRVNGHRIGLGPVMAITYAAHALGLSIPFAGAELDVAVYLLPVAGVLLALRFDRMRALLRSVLERLAALSKRVFGKPEDGGAGVDRFLDEVSSRRLSLPGYGRVFGLALANWAFDCAALALSIRAIGQPVPWDDLLLVYGAGAAVASTGLTPGGFALVELAMATALTASGLHSSAALAAVVAYRFISFWLVLLGGWVAFIVLAHPPRRRRRRRSAGRSARRRRRSGWSSPPTC